MFQIEPSCNRLIWVGKCEITSNSEPCGDGSLRILRFAQTRQTCSRFSWLANASEDTIFLDRARVQLINMGAETWDSSQTIAVRWRQLSDFLVSLPPTDLNPQDASETGIWCQEIPLILNHNSSNSAGEDRCMRKVCGKVVDVLDSTDHFFLFVLDSWRLRVFSFQFSYTQIFASFVTIVKGVNQQLKLLRVGWT